MLKLRTYFQIVLNSQYVKYILYILSDPSPIRFELRTFHHPVTRLTRLTHLRYGLDDGVCRSQRECGLALGMSRANVQNVCQKAFRKLQDTPAGEALFEYMDDGL